MLRCSGCYIAGGAWLQPGKVLTLAYANGDFTVYTSDQMNRVFSVTGKKG